MGLKNITAEEIQSFVYLCDEIYFMEDFDCRNDGLTLYTYYTDTTLNQGVQSSKEDSRDVSGKINLNGFSIIGNVTFYNRSSLNNNVNLTIFNTSGEESSIGLTEDQSAYGLTVDYKAYNAYEDGSEKIVLNLDNVTVAGGMTVAGVKWRNIEINANKTHFIKTSTATETAGFYLEFPRKWPGNNVEPTAPEHVHKLTFTDCYFEGMTGVVLRECEKDILFENCEFHGFGEEQTGTGHIYYLDGNAVLCLDNRKTVFESCKFVSARYYGLVYVVTETSNRLSHRNGTYNCPMGNVQKVP